MIQPESEDINFPVTYSHPDKHAYGTTHRLICMCAFSYDLFGDAEEATDELNCCGHKISHITKDEITGKQAIEFGARCECFMAVRAADIILWQRFLVVSSD